MPTYMANDVSVVVNSTDLSDHVKKVTVDETVAELDATVMGNGTEVTQGGLKKWVMDVEFLQDHTGSSVDVTLRPLLGSNVLLTVKPTSSAVSTTNPRYFGTGSFVGYKVLDVTVGDLSGAVARFVSAGAMTRATT